MPPSGTSPLPVTILSGFLGAGKTTLLQRLLAGSPPGANTAVLENELGGVPVDDALLRDSPHAGLHTVLGRTCCETRREFIEKLREIASSAGGLDRLIIETTGVAHPGMMAHAMLADPALRAAFRIDGIITVVDAACFRIHDGDEGHATEQVAYADIVIINKRDLVTGDELRALEEALRCINGTARFYVTTDAEAPVADLLDIGGFDLARVEGGVGGCRESSGELPEDRHDPAHEIRTVAFSTAERFDFESFRRWLEEFTSKHAGDLYRAKGVVALHGLENRMVFHGVHGRFHAGLGRTWGADRAETKLVFIGRSLDRDAIARGLSACARTRTTQ